MATAVGSQINAETVGYPKQREQRLQKGQLQRQSGTQGSAQNFFEMLKIERALYLGSSILLARIYQCAMGVEYVFNG